MTHINDIYYSFISCSPFLTGRPCLRRTLWNCFRCMPANLAAPEMFPRLCSSIRNTKFFRWELSLRSRVSFYNLLILSPLSEASIHLFSIRFIFSGSSAGVKTSPLHNTTARLNYIFQFADVAGIIVILKIFQGHLINCADLVCIFIGVLKARSDLPAVSTSSRRSASAGILTEMTLMR